MLKKLMLMISLSSVFFLALVNPAAAIVMYNKSGSAIMSGPTYSASLDAYVIFIDKSIVTRNMHRHYTDDTFTTIQYEKDITIDPTWTGEQRLNCKRYTEEIYYDDADNVVGKVRFYANDIVNDNCTSGYEGGSGAGSGACITCDMFNCPGWTKYMQQLEEIQNSIPPAPNWKEVAETFRDTIAPQIKVDLQEILGDVDDPPPPPPPPDKPPIGDDLDDGGIKPPTGDIPPGLEESGFDENDIKDDAPKIDEREDESGGFIINNPIDDLPSQDEFKDNVPDEGDAPIPGDPADPENISPVPQDSGGNDPIPTPIPEDTGGTVDTPPTPDESGTAPLPDNDGSTAPLPGG